MSVKPMTQTIAVIGFVIAVVVLALNGWLFDRNLRRLAEADRWVTHTNEVLLQIETALSTLKDAETGQRGYVITQEPAFLEPYRQAVSDVETELRELEAIVADNPPQLKRSTEFTAQARAKLAEMERVIAILEGGDPEGARAEVRKGTGKQQMDAARKIVADMRREEERLLAERAEESAAGYATAQASNFFAIGLAIVLVVAVFYLIYRYAVIQHEARQAIAQERELLQVTLASIGDGVIATDARGNITFLNPVAERLTGWSDEQARGRRLEEIFRIINEISRHAVENPCTRVLREGVVVGLANHTLLISRSGMEIPIDDSAAPIRGADGRTRGAVLVFRDATAERRATEARERLSAIIEDSEDAIIGQDLHGVITNWNKGAEALFGYTAQEAVGRPVEMLIPPELREDSTQALARLLRGERVAHIDTVRVRKDGTRVDVTSRLSPIRNPEGEIVGASKISHDISDRKRTEVVLQFLAQSSSLLSTLVDYQSTMQQVANLAVPFLADWCIVDMVDSAGAIKRVAHAHRDPAKEPLLKQWVEAFQLDWNSPSLSVQVLRSGRPELVGNFPEALLERMVREPAHRALIEALEPRSSMVVPIVIHDRPVGTLVFVSTRRGRLYSPTDLEVATELAGRAAVAIENAGLYRELKERERQKDDFLAMLAHELRNPLAAIQYANHVAKTTQADGSPAFDVIQRQVNNLARLIDDLLDVSRITRDKIQLQIENIDAATLVRRAAVTVQPAVEDRRHSLEVDLSDKPMPLAADPVRIEQILVNLLSNAIKYTPPGGQISLRVHPNDGQVVFKLKDSGIGIPHDMLPRVFDLFTQVDKSLERTQGGLGIGLTVVRKLAEMHGGSVSAASDGSDQGSEFTVRLPLGSIEPAASESAPAVDGTGIPLKVLVVEDNVDTARSLIMLLEMAGHTTAVAHDGHAAVEAARSFRPDVILMDLGLPGMDGYGVAQTLRREKTFDRMNLVAISGYGQAEDQRRSREAGFNAHLVKPVNFDQLMSILARHKLER